VRRKLRSEIFPLHFLVLSIFENESGKIKTTSLLPCLLRKLNNNLGSFFHIVRLARKFRDRDRIRREIDPTQPRLTPAVDSYAYKIEALAY
jgi:hypothetical protein